MKNKLVTLSTVAVAVLLTFSACGGTDRYDRHSAGVVSDNPGNGQIGGGCC